MIAFLLNRTEICLKMILRERKEKEYVEREKNNVRACFIFRATSSKPSVLITFLFLRYGGFQASHYLFLSLPHNVAPAGHAASEMSCQVTCVPLFPFPLAPAPTGCLAFQTGLLCCFVAKHKGA